MKKFDVFESNQLSIAVKTLKYPQAIATAMGGMTKDEGRAIILRLTGKPAKEQSYEGC